MICKNILPAVFILIGNVLAAQRSDESLQYFAADHPYTQYNEE